MSARSQPDQIDSIRERVRLIEIIDTPYEAAFDVAPGTEVLDVKVADGENLGRLHALSAHLRPELHPAIESGSQEREDIHRHRLVFQLEIRRQDGQVLTEPLLVARGR